MQQATKDFWVAAGEVKAVKLLSIDETPVKETCLYGKKYEWAAYAMLELADGRHEKYRLAADTRAKLADRIARGRAKCANGITGMALSKDGMWIVDIFGGTWL